MLQTIEATIEGIETAIRNGMSQRTRNEQELDARRHALAEASRGLDAVKESLLEIRAAITLHDA